MMVQESDLSQAVVLITGEGMGSVQPGGVEKTQVGQTFADKVDPLDRTKIYSAENWGDEAADREVTGLADRSKWGC